jgi:flavin reductase (DIM6/NTAB) family NADH-FMN oxidoreductase RutF
MATSRKKPWNRTNQPVYSVSTQHNMHICTYVTPVSMQPKRIMVALYHGTQTLTNAEMQPQFVLQLLAQQQYRLVNLLGKQSGKTINKIERLQKRGLLADWNDFYILKDALAVLLLQPVATFDGGDHKGFVCDVIAWKNLNDGEALTLDDLRARKLIRN